MITKKLSKLISVSAASAMLALGVSSAQAETYEVKITNITAGQAFTPRLALTHPGGRLFSPGDSAMEELVTIAEGGDIAPLMSLLETFGSFIGDMQVGDGLLMPGSSQTITIEGEPGDLITIVNMLIPTNDAFLAVNGARLPDSGTVRIYPNVYDAGSETNDENCANIPGPVCGGAGGSPDDEGEGFIHIHPGIHGVGDLESIKYDWKNPAAEITITMK